MHTYIVYRKEMALKLGINVLFSFTLLLINLNTIRSFLLAMFLVIAMFLPLLLFSIVMKWFTRSVIVQLDDDGFKMEISKENNDAIKHLAFSYDEIASYNIQFPNRRFSVLKLKLRDGRRMEFSFLNNTIPADQVDTSDLVNVFNTKFKAWNSASPNSHHIAFAPSFFASRHGLVAILAMSILIIVAIIIHWTLQAKTAPMTLILGIGLFFQVLAQRSGELDYYRKMVK